MRLPLQALASILSLAPISGATFAAILAPNASLAAGVAQAPAADGLDAGIADALK